MRKEKLAIVGMDLGRQAAPFTIVQRQKLLSRLGVAVLKMA